MSIAPLPTPLQHFGGRRFSFYPPIRNLGPNEWLYRRSTWTECIVVNARSGEEVCIPRMFLGEISRVEEAVMIVRLSRDLEWRSGVVTPRVRSVIVMPKPATDGGAELHPHAPAPVINIRLEPKSEVRAWKWIGVAAVLGAVAFTIAADLARQTDSRQSSYAIRGHRSYLQLGPGDNYASTVGKLGFPSRTGSLEEGDRLVRSLTYASRHYSVILMSTKQEEAHYIGTLDMHGRVLDAVRFSDGSTAEALLRSAWRQSSTLRSLPAFR